jgi:antitoxin component YwqK of YwqJK toxin-antitoxin module
VKGYDSNGKLVSEANYAEGVLNGRYTEFYPGFGIKLEGNYSLGDHEGTWLYYDVGGKIIGEGVFVKGSGTQRAFWENGKTKQSTPYKNNKKHGDEILYRENGSIEVTNKYSDGKLVEKIPGDGQKK